MLVLVFSPIIQKEKLIGWHPSRFTRTRIRVIGINLSDYQREMKCSSSQRGIRIIRVRVNRVKMTEKWDEIQGKLDLVRVSGEFELSGFYCKLKYLLYFFPAATWSDLFETESGILEVSLC